MKAQAGTASGRKLPKNYALVLDVVRKQGPGVHSDLNEVFAAAKRVRPGIGYTTVYRALQRLTELGLIGAVTVPGSLSTVFEPAAPHHGHFLCKRCGKLLDVNYTLRASTLRKLAKERGVEIDDASVVLRGVCADCSKRSEARSPS